jgi:peptide-methionine (S)-S-oxide reductase
MFTPFEELDGVLSVSAGYTGGDLANPTYEQVATGETGHAESVNIVFDPSRISYQTLLETFWHNIDPLQEDTQFCAFGSEYRTAIFYHDERQRLQALASRRAIEAHLHGKVFTEVVAAGPFYVAEEAHQHYNLKHPEDYRQWRISCHRQERLRQLWGN